MMDVLADRTPTGATCCVSDAYPVVVVRSKIMCVVLIAMDVKGCMLGNGLQ